MTRSLFLPASPEDAYLVVRDRDLAPVVGDAETVEPFARRTGLPGGTAVGDGVEALEFHEACFLLRVLLFLWVSCRSESA